jgi:hypothetical protein
MSDDKGKARFIGQPLAIIFILAIILLDSFGMCLGIAGPTGYGPLMLILALIGFVCGVALGIYYSKKITSPTICSPYYWLLGGLTGIAIPTFIIHLILVHN